MLTFWVMLFFIQIRKIFLLFYILYSIVFSSVFDIHSHDVLLKAFLWKIFFKNSFCRKFFFLWNFWGVCLENVFFVAGETIFNRQEVFKEDLRKGGPLILTKILKISSFTDFQKENSRYRRKFLLSQRKEA